jgi:hypothetical protein
MPAQWNTFEQAVATYFRTAPATSAKDAAKFLATQYLIATAPAQTQFGQTTLVPKIGILIDAFEGVFSANEKSTKASYSGLANGIIKYWSPGGVILNPFPAAPPTIAPVVAGFFIPNIQFNDIMDQAMADSTITINENTLRNAITNGPVVGDPIVAIPSPIVLFPGAPQQLEAELMLAFTPGNTHEQSAQLLAQAFRNHLSTLFGIYIGFMPPGSTLPINIVTWSGIT